MNTANAEGDARGGAAYAAPQKADSLRCTGALEVTTDSQTHRNRYY